MTEAVSSESGLAQLTLLFPSHDLSTLSRFLNASNGNMERAVNALLLGKEDVIIGQRSKMKKVRKTSEGLGSWLAAGSTSRERDRKDGEPAKKRKKVEEVTVPTGQDTARPKSNAFDLLRHSTASATATPAKPTNLPPLTLSTPALIAQHTKGTCTIIENVLPKELATRLFLRMVQESEGKDGRPGWEKNRWYLFDRQVESPHTTSFYVAPNATSSAASAYDKNAFEEAAQYWYNGEKRPARTFNEEMDEAREVIGPLVQQVLAARERHPLEWKGNWIPNVAAANCYRGSKESVGWHSDVLTYLGPRPTIASLSLGVTRPFRLRAEGDDKEKRTLSIELKHGTLLIMGAGCQERFKHCVPEVSSLDVFRLSNLPGLEDDFGNGVTGKAFRERINITFRFFRPDFAPLPTPSLSPSKSLLPPPGYVGTPICACGIPCHLRPDARGKVKARTKAAELQDGVEEDLLYFWTCNAGAQNLGKNCGYFELLNYKKEGRGDWWKGGTKDDAI